MQNEGLLAIALFEASAFFLLLVLYLLLYRRMSARYFRLWLAGWALFTAYAAAQVLYLAGEGRTERLLMVACYVAATLFFLASIVEYSGPPQTTAYLLSLSALALAWVTISELRPPLNHAWLHWPTAVLESAVLVTAGWILWRHARSKTGLGGVLLAATLMLAGLHGVDQADWPDQLAFTARMIFDGLLKLGIGIGMSVLVIDAERARTAGLNERLRSLTLITAASAQSYDVQQISKRVLQFVVDSLNATHGLVQLAAGSELEVRAADGFSEPFLRKFARTRAEEPWVKKVYDKERPYLLYDVEDDAEARAYLAGEKVSAIVLVRLPGKDAPLGVLSVGSARRRRFQPDEIHFILNVANLLGLRIQNASLLEQAAAAHRQWEYTFNSISDPILVHDRDYRIVRANQTLGDRIGIEAETMKGLSVAQALARHRQGWSQCPYCEEAAGNGDDPDPILGGFFLASNSELHGPGGERLGTVHVLKNITERKRAEEKYRTLVEKVQEGVFISTPEGRFVDFNDAFMRMLGYESRRELLTVDILDTYVDPSDRERLKKLLHEHGSVTEFEFRMRRRDGEIRTALESSSATRDSSGTVIAYQGFVLDITERKRAEQQIRRRNRELMVLNFIGQTLSEARSLNELLNRALRQVTELFGIDLAAIYLLDEGSRVVRRVAAWGHRSEYGRRFPPTSVPAELVQHIRTAHATVLPVLGLPLPPIFRDLQEKEGLKTAYLVVLWSKDRMMGGLVVSSREVRQFSSADLNLLTAVGNQISSTIEKSVLYEETRQAYEDLRRAQEQLLQSEKMAAVGQMISGVAHELNNPLTAILGYSQLLAASEHVTATGAEYLGKLYKQAQRTHRIVNSLLSFARQQKPERLPVSLNRVIEDTLALREYDLKVNQIQVHLDLAQDLPHTAADVHQLQQVFLNILNNAVDAILESADRGDIWVRTTVDAGRLLIEFTDSGTGVHEPLRVFDPFYTTKPVGKGTGLGLSICYGIVSEHGGEISVRNSRQPGRGAVFSISLPVVPIAVGGRPHEPARSQTTSGSRVLLVDNEDAVLELEQQILQERGFLVLSARSGRQAQQILDHSAVDLVVTDLNMPGETTGLELYRWICRAHPGLAGRIVFTMSESSSEETNQALRETGCLFVQKPFAMDNFVEVIGQVMRRANLTELQR